MWTWERLTESSREVLFWLKFDASYRSFLTIYKQRDRTSHKTLSTRSQKSKTSKEDIR